MFPENHDLRELARLAGVHSDPRFQMLLNHLFLPAARRKKLAQYLRCLAAWRSPRPHAFLPAPTQQEAQAGHIPLGRVITGRGPEYEFLLDVKEAAGGILVAGPPGAGKTLLLAQLAVAFDRQGHAVWVYDTEGDLTRNLIPSLPHLLTPGYKDLRMELFFPDPGVTLSWEEYLSKVISSWRDSIFAGDGMCNLSRETAIELHERQGYFTPYDFLAALQLRKYRLVGRLISFFDGLWNRFAGMILPVLGQTFSGGHHDLRAMTERSIAWQLHGLSDDVLSFFVIQLLLRLSLLRDITPDGQGYCIQIFDEFTRFCSLERMRRTTAGEIWMLDYIRTCRKRRLPTLIATQTPHLLPPQVLSDVNTWISFRPSDGRFAGCISEGMNLRPDQEAALLELPDRHPRHAVVRTPGIPNPFLIELPAMEPAWARPEDLLRRQASTRETLVHLYQPPPRTTSSATACTARPDPLASIRAYPISKPLLDYLVICARDWALPVTERDKKHDISPGLGHRYRQRLAAEGLIRFHRILTGRRGGQLQLTEITEAGYRLLKEFDVPAAPPPGRGGFVHRFWAQTVYTWAVRRGYPAQIEQEVVGKPVDVGVIWEEKRVAVEIVIEGIEKELTNLAKDIPHWDQVVFCAVNQDTLDRLKHLVLDKFGEQWINDNRVRFEFLHRFLDRNRSSGPSG